MYTDPTPPADLLEYKSSLERKAEGSVVKLVRAEEGLGCPLQAQLIRLVAFDLEEVRARMEKLLASVLLVDLGLGKLISAETIYYVEAAKETQLIFCLTIFVVQLNVTRTDYVRRPAAGIYRRFSRID